ncbi:hypothetical protein ERU11_23275, partial [Escherichia coli]|nr:hypothetical protein [Escherichia coli]
RREILVLARTGYVVLRIEPAPLACLAPLRVATGLPGVVCGKGRNPTLRLWPAIFSGEIDVFPSERRNMGQEIGR